MPKFRAHQPRQSGIASPLLAGISVARCFAFNFCILKGRTSAGQVYLSACLVDLASAYTARPLCLAVSRPSHAFHPPTANTPAAVPMLASETMRHTACVLGRTPVSGSAKSHSSSGPFFSPTGRGSITSWPHVHACHDIVRSVVNLHVSVGSEVAGAPRRAKLRCAREGRRQPSRESQQEWMRFQSNADRVMGSALRTDALPPALHDIPASIGAFRWPLPQTVCRWINNSTPPGWCYVRRGEMDGDQGPGRGHISHIAGWHGFLARSKYRM